ncbi:MAG: hypothetical protein AAFV43_13780 [Planctomycetota bacterium]
MWLPLMFVFPQLAPTPLELQLLGLISGFTVELVTSSTQLIPVLAATAPGRLGPRFSVGLLGFVGLSAIWGYQAPWISLVFATVHYLIVFSVTAWLSRLSGLDWRRRGQRRPPSDRSRLTTGDLLWLAATLAVLLTGAVLIDRGAFTDPMIAELFEELLTPAHIAMWLLILPLSYVAMVPLLWVVFVRRRRDRRPVWIALATLAYVAIDGTVEWLGRVINPLPMAAFTWSALTWSTVLYLVVATPAVVVAVVGLGRVLRWSGYRLARTRTR